jgi:hypothetical protein
MPLQFVLPFRGEMRSHSFEHVGNPSRLVR